MIFSYGSHNHQNNECSVAVSKPVFFELGARRSVTTRFEISFMLFGDDQSDLTTKLQALEAAYAQDGQDAILYNNNGSVSAHSLYNRDCIGGTRVVLRPTFPVGAGAQYTTFRTGTIIVEGDVLDATTGLLEYRESVNSFGGGPDFVFQEPLVELPQKQILKQHTTFKTTQVGMARGLLGPVYPPPPRWPGHFIPARSGVQFDSPVRNGPPGNITSTDFVTTWTYVFESADGLLGSPIYNLLSLEQIYSTLQQQYNAGA